jgi:monofunctional biosynthetic peptidoglycan transglycosylase
MRALLRWLLLVVLGLLALQLYFILRIAAMAYVNPQSTTFQRSEAWRIASENDKLRWRQQWVPYAQISENLKRAVIASEDGSFANHEGVDWDAVEKAWERNAKVEAQLQKRGGQVAPERPVKVVGGSTITQQLAKNLMLSGERNFWRKGEEFLLTFALERMLSKQRILEIYLNNVEWGEGVFGAEAAARHYYRKSAAQLSTYEAARLAVMLPQPKRFEKAANSAYLAGRAATIQARMRAAELP